MVHSRIFLFHIAVCAVLLTCKCGGNQINSHPSDPTAVSGKSAQDTLIDLEEMTSEYKLGFGDLIEIKFFYNPELNQELIVRPDGRITLPRLGDLFVVGLTPSEIDEIITAKYSEIIRDPDITVIVKSFASQVVYVLGEVNMPGGYDLVVNMTTLQSIALAGGFTKNANPKSVILIRSKGKVAEAERINMSKVIDSGNLTGDHVLRPFDVVYVPNRFIDRVDLFMEKYFEGLLPPFNLYLRGYDSVYPRRSIRVR
ncbi:MAG: polysaccharide biosynthesis/export family protein [Candidatus Glassbacteria bacterium]